MKYIKVKWIHDSSTDPILLYSEVTEDGWEVRKVEVFKNKSYGYASKDMHIGTTRLGLDVIPPIEEIAQEDEFIPAEISASEFEDVWEKALVLGK